MSKRNDLYRSLLKKPAVTLAANIFDPLSARIAQVVGYDVSHDVALLRTSGASNLKTISQGDSGSVNPGQSVQAV